METDLSNEIERIRMELNALGKSLGILHPDVIKKSQQLDQMILVEMKNTKSRPRKQSTF